MTNGCVAQLARAFGSYPTGRWFESVRSHQNAAFGPMVKRLRHHPFTVVSWVRIPLGSPLKTQYIGFIVFHSLYVASFLFTPKLPQNLFTRLGAIASKKRMAAALLYSRLPHMDALSFFWDIQTGVAPLKIRKKTGAQIQTIDICRHYVIS